MPLRGRSLVVVDGADGGGAAEEAVVAERASARRCASCVRVAIWRERESREGAVVAEMMESCVSRRESEARTGLGGGALVLLVEDGVSGDVVGIPRADSRDARRDSRDAALWSGWSVSEGRGGFGVTSNALLKSLFVFGRLRAIFLIAETPTCKLLAAIFSTPSPRRDAIASDKLACSVDLRGSVREGYQWTRLRSCGVQIMMAVIYPPPVAQRGSLSPDQAPAFRLPETPPHTSPLQHPPTSTSTKPRLNNHTTAMKKFMGKKDKGSDDVVDDSNRSRLFGKSKNKGPAMASDNPYAQAPIPQADPYARAGPIPSVSSYAPSTVSYASSSASKPPPSYTSGYSGMTDDSVRRDKSPVPLGGYGGAPRSGYGPGAGGMSGYGQDQYSRASESSGGLAPPQRAGGYGGLGRSNSRETMQTDAGRDQLFGDARERAQKKQDHTLPLGEGQYGNTEEPSNYGAGDPGDMYNRYQDRQLTAEEEEEEDVAATKEQIRFIKQQDVASTRNALRIAQQAEETGRATLQRLGEQGERIHNTENNLDLASNQNRLAEDKARELKHLNRSMFAVKVDNPFTKSSRKKDRDQQIMDKHYSEREQRQATRREAYQSAARKDETGRELAKGSSGIPVKKNLAERSKYQFEADSEDEAMEEEIENNLDLMVGAASRLHMVGQAMGREVDEQNKHIDRIVGKSMHGPWHVKAHLLYLGPFAARTFFAAYGGTNSASSFKFGVRSVEEKPTFASVRMLRKLIYGMASSPKRVPIPKNGVDYRNTVVLAPMVRSGELPSRLMALKYGADLVWGPETIDRAIIGATLRQNPRANTLEWIRYPNKGQKDPSHNETDRASVIFRIAPEQEKSKLIYQVGTASPELAVQAALQVAPYVAGVDVNSGCPKPFSTSGGMGAALLSTPDLLCEILERLVKEIGEKYEIGISVKIRLLKTEAETRTLVERLVKTGITGLTIHCRTRSMRKTEKAIRDQLCMVAEVCREAGVACVMNGDVDDRAHAEQLMREYGVDGAMIATAAEKNPSVFREQGLGGPAPWEEVLFEYMRAAIKVENRWGNTKFLLAQMLPGKIQTTKNLSKMKNYEHVCRTFELDDLLEDAIRVDALLNLTNHETKGERAKRKGGENQPPALQSDAKRQRQKEPSKTDFEGDQAAQQILSTAAVAV
ncbi:hypothetical protein FH972_025924 [Carpinus fangiana]|uniref:t-SNARE coiled-coil homology domain-containing protein n=1 Tax=Carpinus fangiana TaxID=176857 RepID=A0A5N6L2F2_9ROSI|nr:hypothetical protein FH972_025924 [Carpinus fangiana]